MARLIHGAETSISMAFLGDVRGEDSEAAPPLFCHYFCLGHQPDPALRARGDVVAANATSCE